MFISSLRTNTPEKCGTCERSSGTPGVCSSRASPDHGHVEYSDRKAIHYFKFASGFLFQDRLYGVLVMALITNHARSGLCIAIRV